MLVDLRFPFDDFDRCYLEPGRCVRYIILKKVTVENVGHGCFSMVPCFLVVMMKCCKNDHVNAFIATDLH